MTTFLFSPDIALMDRLTYPKKFVLIGCLLGVLLPIVLFFLIEEMNTAIEFFKRAQAKGLETRPMAVSSWGW